MKQTPISDFIKHHFRHFNAATLVEAAEGYIEHLAKGGKNVPHAGRRNEHRRVRHLASGDDSAGQSSRNLLHRGESGRRRIQPCSA
jgi:hypothetical protein